jgi:hypothetical protein
LYWIWIFCKGKKFRCYWHTSLHKCEMMDMFICLTAVTIPLCISERDGDQGRPMDWRLASLSDFPGAISHGMFPKGNISNTRCLGIFILSTGSMLKPSDKGSHQKFIKNLHLINSKQNEAIKQSNQTKPQGHFWGSKFHVRFVL